MNLNDCMKTEFRNKTVLITGAGSGIGEALTMGYLDAGANVIATDINYDQLRRLKQRVSKSPIYIQQTDIRDSNQFDSVFTKHPFENIDIAVHSAGVTARRTLMETDYDTYRSILETNMTGTFYFLQKVVSSMQSNPGGGAIIVVGSINSILPLPAQAVYSATKAAIESLSKSLAVEVASKNIRVNILSPGAIDTPLNLGMTGERRQNLINRIPLARIGMPDDLVGAALFLSSSSSSYITGSTLVVDGGFVVSR